MLLKPQERARLCEWCSTPFEPRSNAQRFCLPACRDAARLQRRWRGHPCAHCGRQLRGRQRLCEGCPTAREKPKPPKPLATKIYYKVCACGTSFVARAPNAFRCRPCAKQEQVRRALRKYYEAKARQGDGRTPHSWYARAARARAAKAGVATDRWTRLEIAERDGWTCQLCHRKINPDLRTPHPMSLEIDHIIPLRPEDGSEGGPDTRENVQAAHRRCNYDKGNHIGAGLQMRLIG